MQFLTVYARLRKNNKIIYGVPVLINGERNGCTGSLLKLSAPGKFDVSVDYYCGAETKAVEVQDTCEDQPLEIVVFVGDGKEETQPQTLELS